MAAPLEGIRIVDLTSVMMGPFATQLLADLGADVLKVEPPAGDSMRAVGPMINPGMGPLYLHANRNKRSIAIDLKSPRGGQLMRELLQDADVLVSNIRSDAMERLGLSYPEVRAIKPDIIYVAAYGFGSGGAYAGKPAYDDLIQGLAGIPSLLMRAGAAEPRYAPSVIADRIVGLNVANVILAALLHRQRTSQGQSIEVPMFETLTQLVLGDHMGGETFMPPCGPMGYARLLAKHRRPYQTADGHICVVVYTDAHWRSFFELTGEQDLLARDDRFSSLRKRTEHIDALYGMVAERLLERPTAQWLTLLNEADIPAMPMHTLESLLTDPHLASVDFFYEFEHPTEGRLRQMRSPSRWSSARRESDTPAPRLGEHTIAELRRLGHSAEEILSMIESGVVLAADPQGQIHEG